MNVAPAATSQSIDVQILDDTGLAVTGLVAATFPAVSWSLNGNTAATSITLSDLAAITTAYSSGGVKERSGGYYRLDLPNAALTTAGEVTLIGDATGKHLLAAKIIVGNLAADLQTIKTQAVTAAAGVTFPASIGTSTYAGGAVASVTGAVASVTAGVTLATGAVTATSIAAAALNGKGDWLLAANYTAPDNADIVTALADLVTLLGRTDPTTALTAIQSAATAIKAKTDALPADPASATNVTAVKTDTGNLIQMTTGTGTSREFTATALTNAPAGGGGGGGSSLSLTLADESFRTTPE